MSHAVADHVAHENAVRTAIGEMKAALNTFDLENADLKTCRQILDMANQHRDTLAGEWAAASAGIGFDIAAVGDRALELGDPELARELYDTGYLYV